MVVTPSETVYAAPVPATPVITVGTAVTPMLSTSAGADSSAAAPRAEGSQQVLVPGELIGRVPDVLSTSRWLPGVFPACGSRGAPRLSPIAASVWRSRPSSPNGSPLRVGSLPYRAARVWSAPP